MIGVRLGCICAAIAHASACRMGPTAHSERGDAGATEKNATATSPPAASERALAASLREPFRRLVRLRARVGLWWPRYAPAPENAVLTFAWGKGARWYHEVQDGWRRPMRGSTLTLWQWGSKQMTVVDVVDQRVRRSAWDTSPEAQALAFLFEDFAERYTLTSAQADPRADRGLLVTARMRAPTTGTFRELRLLVPEGQPRVQRIGLESPVADRMPREFAFYFYFFDLHPLEQVSVPETCFALAASRADASGTSVCPSDGAGS